MRILIVDDERHIANYLFSLIEEHVDSDVEICKTYSGIDALEVLRNMKIDLMILDIYMPGMSGLELADITAANWPKCHIIFLTAYSNFDHIYKSRKYINSKYLLKTETDDTILDTVLSSLKSMKVENEGLHILAEARQKSILLSHLLQENILKEILAGQDIAKLKSQLKITGSDFVLDLSSPVYLMLMQLHLRSIDEYDKNLSTYSLQQLQLMHELLFDRFKFSMLNLGKGSMLWFFQATPECSNSLSSEFTFLKAMTNDFSNYCLTVLHRPARLVLYRNKCIWNEICNVYLRMQQYIDGSSNHFSQVQSSVSIIDNTTISKVTMNGRDKSTINQDLQELSLNLYQGSSSDFYSILNRLRNDCSTIRSMHDITAIKIYNTISLMLLDYIELYHLQEKLTSKTAIYPLYYLAEFNSWDHAFQYLKSLSNYLFELLKKDKNDKTTLLINKIKNYIEEHISESITLGDLANIVNYNETYVSKLFKQITGTGITEYICNLRINKAKELLTTTEGSMQSIAAATGFDTAQYFSVVFKKNVGIPPSEYRRRKVN